MILLRWLLNSIILLLVSYIVPGIKFNSFWAALLTAVVFGLVNAFIRPFVILLTLPVNILTLGLFTLVINGLMFWLAHLVVRGFSIANFSAAIWGALVYWIIVTIVSFIDRQGTY